MQQDGEGSDVFVVIKRTRVERAGHAMGTMDHRLSRSSGPAEAMSHSLGGTLEPPAYCQDWLQIAYQLRTFGLY